MILDDLMASPISHVRTAAAQLAELQGQLASGAITHLEYDDLCSDNLKLDGITDDMADLKLRQQITEAFDALKAIAASGVVPL